MKKKNLVFVWVTIQIVLTASMILLIKYVIDKGGDPLNFSYQILLASVVYLFLYALIKEPKALVKVDTKSLIIIVLAGITGGAITYGLGFLGLQKSTAINYSFLIQTTVFFTPVFAFFFLKEHLKPFKMVLIFTLLIGVYLVSTNGELILPKTGDLYILFSTIAISTSVILTKIALRKVSTLTFSMYRALFGGLSLLLFLLIIDKINLEFYWFWIAIVGLVIAVGIYAMNKTLEYGTASYMQMMNMSVPVITAIFAYIVLGESMTLIQMIGGVIIIASGVFVHKLKI
ncbi:DMT family transporter [Patescibacteria group bacterium]